MGRLRLQSGPRTGWHPLDLQPALRPLYLSAADRGGLLQETAGVVTSWTGRQGGLALTAAGSPAWSATGLAGAYPMVSGDGSSANFTGATTGLPTGTNPCVFAFFGVPGAGTGQIVSYGATSNTYRRLFTSTNGDDGKIIRVVGNNAFFATGETPLSEPCIVVGVVTTTGTLIRYNGVEVGNTAGTLLSTGTTRLRLFSNTAGTAGDYLAAGITELLICTTLTERQIEQFEGYCAHAYPLAGITLPDSHPYSRAAP